MARRERWRFEPAKQSGDQGFAASLRLRTGPARGIVGQVTHAAVVYDAETTLGGRGGPVLDVAGRVVAVNADIIPEYGGSNLGVPADKVSISVNM